jgi:hypothetical protein
VSVHMLCLRLEAAHVTRSLNKAGTLAVICPSSHKWVSRPTKTQRAQIRLTRPSCVQRQEAVNCSSHGAKDEGARDDRHTG